MRKITVKIGLVEMSDTMAMNYCISITRREWLGMRQDDAFALWHIIKSYVQNRFQDDGITAPPEIADAWSRSKRIIDEEIGQ